jgi:hypothetical protein
VRPFLLMEVVVELDDVLRVQEIDESVSHVALVLT